MALLFSALLFVPQFHPRDHPTDTEARTEPAGDAVLSVVCAMYGLQVRCDVLKSHAMQTFPALSPDAFSHAAAFLTAPSSRECYVCLGTSSQDPAVSSPLPSAPLRMVASL